MNKKFIFKKILLFLVVFGALFSLFSFNAKAETLSSQYASYSEDTTLVENNLEHGIYHKKVIASSTASRCTNPSGYSLTNSPQQVNILSVPSSVDTRVVNYTFPSASGWQRKKLDEFVESYEKNNPGWIVIGAVNGDFFDINGNNKLLPYQTTGSALSDGDLLRAVNKKSVGYTNDGSSNSFIISQEATFTEEHYLDIYDKSDNIIDTFKINKVNQAPVGDEIAVYFSYNIYDENQNVVLNKVTVPEENSFVVERPIRCLPTSATTVFAKGYISGIDQTIALQFGQFAIVTSNQEIREKLSLSTKIRVQQDVIGDLAECDQIIGVGSTLMENGEVSTDNSDGMREQRHPRTCIGVKEDGTLMFFVVDGRQQEQNMYGMTHDELGIMMKYYGCYEGVNVDGGGSSTFGIRNNNGDFVIMNSPSDGNLRNNSNALLIVVPRLQLNIEGILDTSAYIKYDVDNDFTISNLDVKLNNQVIETVGNNTFVNSLTPSTEYTVEYSYDLTYKGVTRSKTGVSQSFTTGKAAPVIEKATFDITSNYVNLNFKITDTESLYTFLSIEYKQGIEFIDDISYTSLSIPIVNINTFEIKYVIDYNVGSIPNRIVQKKQQFTWYPTGLNLNLYYEEEQNIILSIIDSVNNGLLTLTKEEVITSINNAKIAISEVLNKEAKDFENYKLSKIIVLNSVLLEEIYVLTNKEQINMIVNSTKVNINLSKTESEVDNYYNYAIDNINKILKDDKARELEDYKTSKGNELENYLIDKKYNSKNQDLVNNLKNTFYTDLENAISKDEVDVLYDSILTSIKDVKTKGCNSNSLVILSILLSNLTVLCILLIKKFK